MVVATMHPHIIDKLVLNDIGYLIPKQAMKRIATYASNPPHFSSKKEAHDYLRKVAEPFGITKSEHWDHFNTHSISGEKAPFTLNYDEKILEMFRQMTANYAEIDDIDLRPYWASVQHETLLLRGDNSDVLPLEIANSMNQQANVTLKTYQNVGHAPALMEDSQTHFILDWLRS